MELETRIQDLTPVHFRLHRKGSVIAAVEISGLKTPRNDETDLTRDLEEAINDNKMIGSLNVSNVDEIPTTSAGEKLNSHSIEMVLNFVIVN